MYEKYTPTTQLQSTVDRYWKITNSTSENIIIEILPDHCFDLVFVIKNDSLVNILITGIYSQIQNYELEADTTLIGINFYPNGLINYFNISLRELLNSHTNFHRSMLKYPDQLDFKALFKMNTFEAIIELMENYLLLLPIVNSNLPSYYNSEQVKDIASDNFMSLRTLRRYYNKWLGITPKEYIQLARQVKARHLLLAKEALKVTDIALELDYTDHAHFTKHFTKVHHLSPKAFQVRDELTDIYKNSSFL